MNLCAALPSDEERERTRARLREAGLLVQVEPFRGQRPSPDAIARARRAAAKGKPLTDYVIEGRS